MKFLNCSDPPVFNKIVSFPCTSFLIYEYLHKEIRTPNYEYSEHENPFADDSPPATPAPTNPKPKKRLLGGICTYNSDEETEPTPSKQYMGTVPEGKDYCQAHDPDNICKGVKVVKECRVKHHVEQHAIKDWVLQMAQRPGWNKSSTRLFQVFVSEISMNLTEKWLSTFKPKKKILELSSTKQMWFHKLSSTK